VLLRLESLISLVLSDLILNITGMRRVSVVAVVSRKLRVDCWHDGSEPVTAGLCSLAFLHVLPLTPIVQPCLVVLAEVEVDVETPAHGLNPIELQSVQLDDGDTTDLRPRPVLEGIVVKEFASQKKRDGEVTPDLAFGSLVRPLALHAVNPLGEIIHSEKNRRTRQSRRGEYLRNELPKRRCNVGIWSDDSRRHLSNILCHQLDLIVEDSTNASRHLGEGGESDKDQGSLSVGRKWIRPEGAVEKKTAKANNSHGTEAAERDEQV